jgi:alkaline phosphatase D
MGVDSVMRFRVNTLVCGAIVSLMWASSASPEDRTFVVLLFDGFAPQYIDAFSTPTFDQLKKEGAWSHAMDPTFPTLSLIGGTTISTGCWPEHHGIMSNVFLDPERGRYDHAGDADWLTGCEHLHQAAERQGVASAAFGWYGRYSTEHGPLASVTPENEDHFRDYPDDMGRAAQVVEQLARPIDERPRLILAYFKGPDTAGHFQGMESEETRRAVTRADSAVRLILDAIKGLPDAGSVQLLITTDHGMVPVAYLVNMRRILRRHDIDAEAVSSGTSSFLYFDDPTEETLSEAQRLLAGYSQFKVVRRNAQPRDWHLGSGPRVGQLIVSASPPYFIEDPDAWPWIIRWMQFIGPDFLPAKLGVQATHGYEPGTPGVEGILYTRGSAFAAGREVDRVRAIDLHPTIMHVLGIEPGKDVDGSVELRLLR